MKLIIATLLLLITTVTSFPSFLDLLASFRIGDLGIRTVPLPVHSKYDFIVIGSGTGGSVVANRLSENPKWKILLLEAGKPEGFLNQIPMSAWIFQQTDYNWGYKMQPQKTACLGMKDNRCNWLTGKSLGGSSSINFMIHTRGNKLDYDEWSKLGNDGWSYDEVLPYFRKSEKLNIPGDTNWNYHGTDGYVHVEHAPYHSVLAKEYLRAARQSGYEILDYNGREQIGFSYIQATIDKGERCSASRAYLRVKRSNLDIVTEARVTRILIDEKKRAYGVEYEKRGVTKKVYATKEVILSAGTIDSAQLLMLSGIGPRDHLEELGIEVIKDSKVGYNLHEHLSFLGLTFLVDQSVTFHLRNIAKPSVVLRYAFERNGPLSVPSGVEATGFIRTRLAPDSRPDVELLFGAATVASDYGLFVRKFTHLTDETYNTVYKPIENRDSFIIWSVLLNPRSHGRIRLKSKKPFVAPLIETNYFTHPDDVETILEGVKHAINITKTEPFRAYGTKIHDIKTPGCESHEFGSDDYWKCAIRHLPAVADDGMGTIKMGPASDKNAVVDSQLRVYGIHGLRVVDASIMPKIPAGHINAGIYMIGEKASDMIKKSWKGRKNLK